MALDPCVLSPTASPAPEPESSNHDGMMVRALARMRNHCFGKAQRNKLNLIMGQITTSTPCLWGLQLVFGQLCRSIAAID